MDFAKVGVARSNAVVRGFNNVFSGTLLTLTDNRIARVPSLRVNAFNFIPLTNDDVERIEVVLGPGSALYGPNSADGVMHIITRSPFASQGTSVNVGMGERSLRQTAFRHAGAVGERLGYKVSAQYYTSTEWEYADPEEVEARELRKAAIEAGADLPPLAPRDHDSGTLSVEARLDWRPTGDLTAILSAGHSESDVVGLTGVGASQAKDWQYNYTQLRLLYGDWFFQAFRNWNDAGGTYLLRTGDPIVDRSSLNVFQAQHTTRLGQRQRFTYGFDALMTRPDTDGTIMGGNEEDDDLNEFGGYVQSETALADPLDLVLALRYDYHSRLADPELSPRAALVFKPRETQTLRLTFNRAFSTPTSNNLYLDIITQRDPFGLSPSFIPLFTGLGLGEFKPIDIWTQGNYQRSTGYGFTFRRDEAGRPLFRSPFSPLVAGQAALSGLSPGDAGYPIGPDGYMALDHPLVTNVMWGIGRQGVLAGFGPAFQQLAAAAMVAQGVESEEAQAAAARLAEALPGVVPEQLPGLRNVMGRLNIESEPLGEEPDPNRQSFFFVEADGATPITAYDVPRIHSAGTRTVELGYKGVVADKIVVAADLYQSRIENFVGAISVETPNVFLDPQSLGAALGEGIGQALSDPDNAELAGALAALDAAQVPGVVQGNNNGTPVDELAGILTAGSCGHPLRHRLPGAGHRSLRDDHELPELRGRDHSRAGPEPGLVPRRPLETGGELLVRRQQFLRESEVPAFRRGSRRRPERPQAQTQARGEPRLRQVGTVGWRPGAPCRRLPHELRGLRRRGGFLHGAGSQPGIPAAAGSGPGAAGRREQRPGPVVPGVRWRPGGGTPGIRAVGAAVLKRPGRADQAEVAVPPSVFFRSRRQSP